MPSSRELDLVLTLTGGFTAALVLGLGARRLRLSPVVGYLLAGVVVGPFTPGFVAHGELTGQLAELGVVLLMFGVGLHFRLADLLSAKERTVLGALLGMAAAAVAGFGIAHFMGWGTRAAAAFGLALAPASTVVMLRAMEDQDALHSDAGRLTLRWLVVEDLVTVVLLALLPVAARGGLGAAAAAKAAVIALVKVGALVALALYSGRSLVPRMLTRIDRSGSRELFTLAVLVVALGTAVVASRWFGVSMALGAFIGGTVVGQSPHAARAGADALPLRDAFAVLFFVSVGMLLDPAHLVADLPLTLAVTAAVLLCKPLVVWTAVRLSAKRPPRGPGVVAASVAQIGEFSFIVASSAIQQDILPARALQSLVAAAIVAIAINPFIVRRALGRD